MTPAEKRTSSESEVSLAQSLFPAGMATTVVSGSNGAESNRTKAQQSEVKKSKQNRFNSRYPQPEKPRQKRAVIQDMVRPLKHWLLRHRHNPYPTKAEKIDLALGSNMSLVQVSNWFANARRRLKNVVQEPKFSWSKRLRMYNQFVQGNAELLSISSKDSIWDSDSDRDQDNDDDPLIDVEATSEPAAGKISPSEAALNSSYKRHILHRYLSDSVRSHQLDSEDRRDPTAVGRKRKLDDDCAAEPPRKRPCEVGVPLLPRPLLPTLPPMSMPALPTCSMPMALHALRSAAAFSGLAPLPHLAPPSVSPLHPYHPLIMPMLESWSIFQPQTLPLPMRILPSR